MSMNLRQPLAWVGGGNRSLTMQRPTALLLYYDEVRHEGLQMFHYGVLEGFGQAQSSTIRKVS